MGKKQNFIDAPYSLGQQGERHLKPNNPEILNKKIKLEELDFRALYDIEKYLFDTVHKRFINQGHISAPDFFLIVIWKSNRSKSKIAKRLLKMGYPSLEVAVNSITAEVNKLNDSKKD